MPQGLPCQLQIRVRELGNPFHMINPIDMLRNARRGDVPIIVP